MIKIPFLAICTFFLTFLSGKVFSAVDAPFLQVIDTLSTQRVAPDIMCAESQREYYGNEADVLKCISDICGPVEKLSPARPTLQNIDEYLEKLQLQSKFEEVRPEVEKVSAIMLETWEKRKKELQHLSTPSNVNQFFNNLSDEKLSSMMSKVLDVFERPKFIIQNGQITPIDRFRYDDYPAHLVPRLKKIRAQALIARAQGPLGVKHLTDDRQKKQAISRLREKYSEYFKVLKENHPQTIANFVDPSTPEFVKKNEDTQLMDLMFLEEKYLDKVPRSFCQEECQKVLKDTFLERTQKLSGLYQEMGKDVGLKKNDFMLQCQTYAALSNQAKSRSDEVEKKLPAYYGQILDKFSPYLSEHSRSLLGTKLNSTEFSNSGALGEPLKNLKEMAEGYGQKKLQNESVDEYLFNNYKYFIKLNKNDLSPFKMSNVCSDPSAHTVWDYVRSSVEHPSMNLSHFTCLNHDHNNYAENIIYHELGHLFNAFVNGDALSSSSKKISQTQKKCISSQYKSLPLDNEGYNVKTSEDYADFFAAVVASGDADQNGRGICNALKTDSSQRHFTEIHLDITSGTHSNSVFRLLHWEHVRGNALPASCQQVFDKYKGAFEFKDCR